MLKIIFEKIIFLNVLSFNQNDSKNISETLFQYFWNLDNVKTECDN